MITTAADRDFAHDQIRLFEERIALLGMIPDSRELVLGWRFNGGSVLFVGMKDGKPFACDLHRAQRFARGVRLPAIRNGSQMTAEPMPVGEARDAEIAALRRCVGYFHDAIAKSAA